MIIYLSSRKTANARVVELADSLDSGSSVHSGRAGSSPASRTKALNPSGFRAFLCIPAPLLLGQLRRFAYCQETGFCAKLG